MGELPSYLSVVPNAESHLLSGPEFDAELEREMNELDVALQDLAKKFGVELKEIPEANFEECCRSLVPGSSEYIQNHLYTLSQQLSEVYTNRGKIRAIKFGVEKWKLASPGVFVNDGANADEIMIAHVAHIYQLAKTMGERGKTTLAIMKEILPDIDTWFSDYETTI